VGPNSSSRPVGPTAKRQPSPAGLGYRWRMIPSTVGAALPVLPQPHFAIPGRGTSLSNKINATESAIPLIWTALAELSPGHSPTSPNLFRMFFDARLYEDGYGRKSNLHDQRSHSHPGTSVRRSKTISPRSLATLTSSSAPLEAPGSRKTASHRLRSRCAMG
jgi:hypothetical protein